MRVCILCEDKNIKEARENSKNLFPINKSEVNMSFFSQKIKDSLPKEHLSIPLSQSGELPATHWFCFISTNEESLSKMRNNALYSIIEESSPKEFLEKWNLKIIKS